MTGDATTAETGDSTHRGDGVRPPDENERATSDAEREDESETDTDATARPANDDGDGETVTRRAFVRAAGATAAAGAAAAAGTDEATAQAQTYRFGGEVAAWQGRAPSAIEGESNPTIELEAGTEYEFWFENVDGQPHNIVIQDGDGNAIVESELVQGEGATASVTFTATPQAAQYICTVHPTTMVGDLEVTGELEGQGGGLPLESLVLVAGLVLAFVSPILFALFLFSRRGRGGEETTVRR